MPQKSQLHVNQLLSNVSLKYKSEGLVWRDVFPQVPVVKDSDLYRVYDRNFRIPETKRAAKGVAREFGFDVSTASYALEQHALKDYVGTDEAENYDLGGLQQDTTENLTEAIERRIEKSLSDLMVKANWSLNVSLAAGAQFNANTTTSDPVPVFDTAATSIIANSGITPNFGVMKRTGVIACKNHVSILDRVKYTSAEVTPTMLAALFGLPTLLQPTGVYDAADEGAAASITDLWGDIAFVGWKPGSPGLKTPSCGYMFMRDMPRVRTWDEPERKATAVEVEIKFQPKIVASLTGYLIGDIL